MSKITILPPTKTKPRMSPKVREAVTRMVRYGATQVEAAKTAGLSRQGLGKALKRPEVIDLVVQTRQNMVTEVDNLRVLARVAAYEAAIDLMLNSKDERIKVRMIELLTSDSKASGLTVNVDARSADVSSGYTYTRPGDLHPVE